jgi:predicted DNA-binding mobile mystery protein A
MPGADPPARIAASDQVILIKLSKVDKEYLFITGSSDKVSLMTKGENAALARKRLDTRFNAGSVRAIADRPASGWIRAIRDALGMSSRQLASRIGQTQPALTQLERSELNGGARLDSLRRAAEALDCDLVYALVPRTSLEDIVQRRAQLLARRDLASVDRTMRLEDQGLNAADLEERINDYASHLVAEGHLWDDDPGA